MKFVYTLNQMEKENILQIQEQIIKDRNCKQKQTQFNQVCYRNKPILEYEARKIHSMFAESYYINQLSIIQNTQKITKQMTSTSMKEISIKIYDMICAYQSGFKDLGISYIYKQILDLYKLMGKITLLSIDRCPMRDKIQKLYKNQGDKTIEKQIINNLENQNRLKVSEHTGDQKIDRKYKAQKLGGICIYLENYQRTIDKNCEHQKRKTQKSELLTMSQVNLLFKQTPQTEEDIRHSIDKKEMEYFIQRRKKLSQIYINDNHEYYGALQKSFFDLQRDTKHFLSKYERDFQLQKFQFINSELNQQLTNVYGNYSRVKKQRKILLQSFYSKLKDSFNKKVEQITSKFIEKQNANKNKLKSKQTQTLIKADETKQYIKKIKQIQNTKQIYESMIKELQQKYIDLSNSSSYEKTILIQEYEKQLTILEKQNKKLKQKVNYFSEVNKKSGKDLITLFEGLSQNSKKYFMNIIGLNSEKNQILTKRISGRVDRFRSRQRIPSRHSSLASQIKRDQNQKVQLQQMDMEKMIQNQQYKQQQNQKQNQQQQNQQYKINIQEISKNSDDLVSDSDKLIATKNKQKKISHFKINNTIDFLECKKSKSSSMIQHNSKIDFFKQDQILQKKQAQEQKIDDNDHLRCPIKNSENDQSLTTTVKLINFQIQREISNEEPQFAEFPALKPGKVKKTNKKESAAPKVRQSFEKCIDIQSKVRGISQSVKKKSGLSQNTEDFDIKNDNIKKSKSIDYKNMTDSKWYPKNTSSKLSQTNLSNLRGKPDKKIADINNNDNNKRYNKSNGKSEIKNELSPLRANKTRSKKSVQILQINKQMFPGHSQSVYNQSKIELNEKKHKLSLKVGKMISQEQQIRKIAQTVEQIEQFHQRVTALHMKNCQSTNCLHIKKYVENFQKYRKNNLKKRSIKISVHNMQQLIK